ncbi:hypothetical protein BGZ83_001407 [Gryganskiella cystojenkinii]|nr:hypothetical protein BGZ83_001407 [Gryganskiella cystojenkinii]
MKNKPPEPRLVIPVVLRFRQNRVKDIAEDMLGQLEELLEANCLLLSSAAHYIACEVAMRGIVDAKVVV